MTVKEWEEELAREGYRRIFVWQDAPHTCYPDHTHPADTAHVVLAGEMTLTSGGKTLPVKSGERFDVPANTVHSAKMGPQGCRYIVGEK